MIKNCGKVVLFIDRKKQSSFRTETSLCDIFMYPYLLIYYGNMSFTYETCSFKVKNSMATIYI